MSQDPSRQTAIQPQGQQQGQPQGLSIPIDQIKNLAKMYVQWGGFLGVAGIKVPKEIDMMLRTIAQGGEPTPEQLNQMQGMINQAPERQIGEPVLTYDLARTAWRMHKEGASLREIAEEFTKQGNPVSHSTVCDWINRYEDDVGIEEQERSARRKALAIKLFLIGGAMVGFLALGKFLL